MTTTQITNVRVGWDENGAPYGWFVRWNETHADGYEAKHLDCGLEATTEAEAIAEAARMKGVDEDDVTVM